MSDTSNTSIDAQALRDRTCRRAPAGLAVFSIVSALIFHHALGDQNQLFHFLKTLAMAGGLIQVVAFGAGTFSLDKRKRAPRQSLATR